MLNLTHITDRLPALSGLASDFQSAADSRYLAGVWDKDIPRALSWYVPPWGDLAFITSSTSSCYIAPSWSWAAAKFGVEFVNYRYENQFCSDLDIVATKVTPTGLDKFGAVEGGSIEAYGRIRSGLIKELPDLVVPGRRTLYLLSGNSAVSVLAIYAPDDAGRFEGREFTVLLLYLGTVSVGSVIAMAVKPVVGKCNTYERVGLAFSFSGHGSSHAFKAYFYDVAKTRILMV
jgi:hypothetical protein